MKKEFTFEGKRYKVEGNTAVEIENNNQGQDERAKIDALQSKSNKRDMGNSVPVDLKELKTLKDLSWDYKGILFDEEVKIISEEKLKQEAINDFKNPKVMDMTAQEYIFVKFNITEEDLK